MDSRQRQLIQEVYTALKEPLKSIYAGEPFNKVAAILSDKLNEVMEIERELQN